MYYKKFKIGSLGFLTIIILLNLFQQTALAQNNKNRTLVYVGGGDNSTGAWDGYLGDPNGWVWVRQNADGYYTNVFPYMDLSKGTSNTAADYNQDQPKIQRMANLFSNKNLFYETEATSYANRVFDQNDVAIINMMTGSGFNITYATCNGQFTTSRVGALHTAGTRPVLAMQGPWTIGGDINSTAQGAVDWRSTINMVDGSATDGPIGLWADNTGNVQAADYSAIKYVHAQNKMAMVMLCPYSPSDANGAHTGDKFLRVSKDNIRGHEDNDAMPDLWVVSYYAGQLQQYPVTPEQNNGVPAPTITGVAYYLIHHLKDLDKNAQLQVPTQSGITVNNNNATMQVNTASKSFQVTLNNTSSWLDLIPALTANIADFNQKWNVSFQLNNQDVTASVLSQTGLVFYKSLRLNPGITQTLTVTVSSKSGLPIADPLDISLLLRPHPTEPSVEQTLVIHINSTVPESPFNGSHIIPGIIQAEDYDFGGEGVSYHDSDPQNNGGTYRLSDGVDIEACTEGGYDLGWTVAGEWQKYSVNILANGTYKVAARVSCGAVTTPGSFHIEFDGVNTSGTINATATGGWQNWTNVNDTFNLTAGTHIMRVYYEKSDVNVNNFTFTNLSSTGTGNGLAGNYFNGMNFETPVFSRRDDVIQFDWNTGSPDASVNVDQFSARWTGQIQPKYTDTYTFYINSDNGRRLWINGQLIIDKWISDYGIEYSGTITLKAGQKYDIKLEYFENDGGANCKLEWSSQLQTREVVPKNQLYANQLPMVSITAPTNNAVYTSPASLIITANANDMDGSISKVEFYNGTTLLNTDNAAPYSYTWTNVGTGTHMITARAYDNANAVTTSSSIEINIDASVPTSTNGTSNPLGIVAAPIPFQTTTTISMSGLDEIQSIAIYNAIGQEVQRIENVSAREVTIGEALSDGMYLVYITTTNGTTTMKVLKGN